MDEQINCPIIEGIPARSAEQSEASIRRNDTRKIKTFWTPPKGGVVLELAIILFDIIC